MENIQFLYFKDLYKFFFINILFFHRWIGETNFEDSGSKYIIY